MRRLIGSSLILIMIQGLVSCATFQTEQSYPGERLSKEKVAALLLCDAFGAVRLHELDGRPRPYWHSSLRAVEILPGRHTAKASYELYATKYSGGENSGEPVEISFDVKPGLEYYIKFIYMKGDWVPYLEERWTREITECTKRLVQTKPSQVEAPPQPPIVSAVESSIPSRTKQQAAVVPISLPPVAWEVENIAVANLTAYTLSAGEAKTLTEKLHSALVDTKYFRVLSRSDMKDVLEAQKFSRSDYCDDTQCLVEMGKLLPVTKIVGGSVGKVGTTFSLSLRLVNVNTGETEAAATRQLKEEPDQLLQLVEDAGRELALKYGETKKNK